MKGLRDISMVVYQTISTAYIALFIQFKTGLDSSVKQIRITLIYPDWSLYPDPSSGWCLYPDPDHACRPYPDSFHD